MSITITTEMLKDLREKTGISVMQCKKALEESDGDMEKALMILKKKSSEIALKKSDRAASDGIIVVKKDATHGVLVILNCETDFVAKNSDFVKLADDIAEKAFAEGEAKTRESATDMINPVIQKIGENIVLGNIVAFEGPVIGTYVHNGKAGVVTVLSAGNEELAKDISMHIAAMKPEYKTREDVPEEKIQMAKELFMKEIEKSDKPEDIKKKMLDGKIDTYFKELTLLDQPFVKNPEMTIAELLAKSNATLVSFMRETI